MYSGASDVDDNVLYDVVVYWISQPQCRGSLGARRRVQHRVKGHDCGFARNN